MNFVKPLELELTELGGFATIPFMGSDKLKRSGPPQSDIDQIAFRLQLVRTAMNLAPIDVCRAAGIAPNTYSQWEAGHGRPSIDQARKLSRSLKWGLNWIYEGDRSDLPHATMLKVGEMMVAEWRPEAPKWKTSKKKSQ